MILKKKMGPRGLSAPTNGNVYYHNTVKILLNARALIQNSSFRKEVDGRLLEATLYGNIKEFIY